MLRLAFFPVLLFVGLIVLLIIGFILYRKLKQGIAFTYKKGAELANEQQQKWAQKEQQKKLPEILQKGFDQHQQLSQELKRLPQEWQLSLEPLVLQAKEILDEVAYEVVEENSQKKLDSIRSFFHHSLDALLQFSETLNKDHRQMTAEQLEKARQNINLFKADLLSHQQTLQKARRLDFDVLMDVIKARLKR